MKKYLSLIVFFVYSVTFPQKKIDFVKAKAVNFPTVGSDFLFQCTLNVDEVLKSNDELLLYGYFSCNNQKSGIYKVLWKSKPYFIQDNMVQLSPEDESFLKSLDSNQENEMTNRVKEIIKKDSDEARFRVESLIAKYNAKGKSSGILFKKAKAYDESEYTKGTGFSTVFLNTGSKTIKYIWFTVKGINPVGDLVSVKTLKGVGFVKPKEEGSYEFDYVWTTDLVETTKLSNIKIQYVDNTIKTIQNGNDLIVGESLYDFMFGEEED